jgi:phosphoribosylformylglycinamidine (FGAM) synthase-like enzyme
MEGFTTATPEQIEKSGLSKEQLSTIQQQTGKELLSIELNAMAQIAKSVGSSVFTHKIEASKNETLGITFGCHLVQDSAELVKRIVGTQTNNATVLYTSNHFIIESNPSTLSNGLQILISKGDSEISRISVSSSFFHEQNVTKNTTDRTAAKHEISFSQPENLKAIAQQIVSNSACSLRLKQSIQQSPLAIRSFEFEGQKMILSLSGNSAHISAGKSSAALSGVAVESILQVAASGHQAQSISAALFIHVNDLEHIQQILDMFLPQLMGISHAFHIPLTGLTLAVQDEEQHFDAICAVSTLGLPHPEGMKTSQSFQSKGDLIFILGENPEDINGSIYATLKKQSLSTPYSNIARAKALQQVLNELTNNQTINAAKICATGGIYLALLELSLPKQLGFDIVTDAELREDAFLFGEAYGRAIVTVNEDNEDDFIEHMMNSGVTFTLLGHVTQGKLVIDDEHFGFSKDVAEQLNK